MSRHHRGDYDTPQARAARDQTIREEPTCQIRLPGCTGLSTVADHIIPASKGGPSIRSNMRGACESCNRRRGNKTVEEAAQDLPDWLD